MLLGNVIITKVVCRKYRLWGWKGVGSPHGGLNPFQQELALAEWRGRDGAFQEWGLAKGNIWK